jgi:hypothetical protein
MRRGCNDCTVGPGRLLVDPPRDNPRNSGSTAPTIAPGTANRWGAKAEPPVFTHLPGGFAVNARSLRVRVVAVYT